MTVVIGILALIGLAVVGAVGWAFAHGVRDGLAQWREVPPGGTRQPVPVGASPLSLSAALPSSYQAGQLAGEVAASWHSAHQAARAAGAGAPASSSWAAALALGSELSQQRQEAGRAMQAAMAQVLQDNEQAVRGTAAGAASGRRDTSNGESGASSSRGRAPGGARSSDRLGRTSGSRERLAPFSIHIPRRFRPLVAKTTAPTFVATKWRVCPFCFLGWRHRNGSKAARVASLGNSESGGLATRECSWNVWDKGNRLPMREIAGSWIARSK